jgi:hypothetical protein
MKARVVTVQIQPSKLDEAIRIYRDSVVPVASEYKGCHAVFLATDRSSGKGVSITMWDEQELQSSEASGYLQEQFAKFADVFAAPPIREVYDVGNWDRASRDPSNVRMVTTQLKPGLIANAAANYRDNLLPTIRQQPGYLGAMQLVDPVTAKVVSATAWASESDMLAGEVSGGYLDQLRASMDPQNSIGQPTIEHFAISVRWVRQS